MGYEPGRSLDQASACGRTRPLAGICCFHDKNACVARALTFYFRMKHTIRGHERETNVETQRGEEKPAERERESSPSLLSRGTRRERETLFVLRRAIREEEAREKETERDATTGREDAKWKDRGGKVEELSRRERKEKRMGKDGERRRDGAEAKGKVYSRNKDAT